MRAERVRQDIWQPVPGRLLGVGGRFIVADRKASPGAEGGARRLIPLAGLLIPLALLLILEATGPGPPSERAGKVVLDRRRGRSDCGDVHQASEDPAAQTVTMVPISAAIPSLPVPLTIRRARPAEAETWLPQHRARVARSTIK